MKTAMATQSSSDSLRPRSRPTSSACWQKAEVATSEAAMGECVGKAAELEGNLETAGWEIFEAIGKLTDDRQGHGRGDPRPRCERRWPPTNTPCTGAGPEGGPGQGGAAV